MERQLGNQRLNVSGNRILNESHISMPVKGLLACGAAASLLYVVTDVLAALRCDGYSYADQTISELSAIDAPTRSLWLPLGFVYSVLTIAFGYGVWASAGKTRALRIVAALVAVTGILGLVAWPLAPMHQREVMAAGEGTLSDTVHLALGAVDSLLFFLIIAFGAGAFGKGFRLYSIATILVIFLFGALTAMEAPKVEENEPTPWLGVKERKAVFGPMLWFTVVVIFLWRKQDTSSSDSRP